MRLGRSENDIMEKLGRLAFVPVALVGVATGFFRLGAKGLWGDEVWEVSWPQEQDFIGTFQRFHAPPDLPLHFLLTKVATEVSTNESVLRLPAALLGIATVILVYVFGRRIFGNGAGLVAGLLLAVAPYHVWYTQDARPYAGLAFYSLLSLYCFYRLLERPSFLLFLGFTIANLLNIYNHLFGLLPLVTEGLATIAWAIFMLVRFFRERSAGSQQAVWRSSPLFRVLPGLGISVIVVLLLTQPLHNGILDYLVRGAPGEIEAGPFLPTLDFVSNLFGLFGAGISGWFYLFAAFFLVGSIAALYRRQYAMLLLLAWLVVPFILLWIAQPRHIFLPKYFLFLQPVYLLVTAYGILQVGNRVGQALARSIPVLRTTRAPASPDFILSSLLTLIMLTVAFIPTWRTYWVEKINDWSGVCSYLRQHAEAGDFVIGDGYIFGIEHWCFQVMPGSPPVSFASSDNYNSGNLRDLAKSGQTTWYLTFPGGNSAAALAQVNFQEIQRAAWAKPDLAPSAGDGTRLPYPQAENPVAIYLYKSDHAPRHLVMHDVRGESVVAGWPDYAQLAPGATRSFRMGLPLGQPRVLRITYLAQTNRDIRVEVDNKILATLKGDGNEGWISGDVPLPPESSENFILKLTNSGTEVAAWSDLQVNYASNDEQPK